MKNPVEGHQSKHLKDKVYHRLSWAYANLPILISGGVLVIILLIAILGPVISPYSPSAMVGEDIWEGPSGSHLLGTDMLGRDMLSRMIYGARLTIFIALAATVIAFTLGTLLGFLAAVSSRNIDNFLGRIIDLFMAIPPLIMALLVIAGLGSSIPVLIFTMGFIESTRVFRLARAVGMEIAAFDYVDVARARGESPWWIMWREILPNTIAPLVAELGLRFTFAILFLSALSFLGLGIQPPSADWGSLVKENLQGLMLGSWAAIYPAIAISLLTICVNYIVDWRLSRSNRNISEEMM